MNNINNINNANKSNITEIVVVSDTHRSTGFIETLVNRHPNAKAYLHAGDSELQAFELEPFLSVKGNCDYYITNPIRLIDIKGIKILMFHGDKFFLDLDMLVNYGNNYDAKIVIHGHTHIPYYNCVDGVHILCPGSIAYPRVSKATYALISIDNITKNIKVEILNYANR